MDVYPTLISIIVVVLLLGTLAALLIVYRKSRLNERLLTEQLNAFIESSSKRTEFFYNMVHDLKTPLSVIMGAVQLIEQKRREQSHDDHTSGHLKTIKCNSYRMLRLTTNLLDLAKSEAGFLLLKPVNCDLDMLLDEIVESVRPYAEKKQLELCYKRAPQQIITALDIEKTERVMLNLLSNAIKFSNPGDSVIVSSYKSEDRAFISVRDTGSGIPAEQQSKIFSRYRQAGCFTSAENEGSGIGLSLVKSLVELHHGSIKLNSEINKGSEFIIDLPIKATEGSTVFTVFSTDTAADHYPDHSAEAADIEFKGMHTFTT